MTLKKIRKTINENTPISWGVLLAVLGCLAVPFAIFPTKGQSAEQDKRISNLEQHIPQIDQRLGSVDGKLDEVLRELHKQNR